MYTIDDIKTLLSKNTAALLQNDSSLFTEIEKQTAEIVASYITVTNPPQDFLKQPFVWILEYLIQAKFSGQSPELISMVSERFKEALRILDQRSMSISNSASAKVVNFNDTYSTEI
ncbi:MAG: hypothetical protein B6D44_15180 [Ignavibacteriales bacterium UTCHB2]|jgi:hypothetical protein|nr:MAG: hypothetical protein B6D44_15180 [Ignavibacteriales bacterium UTCHB2]